MSPRFIRALREDGGSILIAVVGIMMVLTVLAIGAFSMADNDLLQSKRERNRAQALTVAEAGLDEVMWRIKNNHPPTSGTELSIEVTGSGSAVVMPTLAGSGKWHVVSTGHTTKMPTVTRTISADAVSLSIYDMFYADGPMTPGSQGRINGNGTFHGSAYMRGDWPPSAGNAIFLVGPFFVKDGNVTDAVLGGSSQIGPAPPETPVDLYCNGIVSATQLFATVYPSVPDLPMPEQTEADISTLRTKANNESIDNIQGTRGLSGNLLNDEYTRTSGEATGMPNPLVPPYTDRAYAAQASADRHYKVVDNNIYSDGSLDTVYIGKSAAGVVLPSFGRPFDPDLVHSYDDFSWDATRGILTVQGTVYIDAQHVVITDVRWVGKGTIVAKGDVTINGVYEPVAIKGVDGISGTADDHADPSDNLGYPKMQCLGISANGMVNMLSADGYGVFYSAVGWTMDTSGAGNNSKFHGEIVAPEITMGHNAQVWTTPGMGSALPPSLPGGTGQFIAVTGWHEGAN